MIAELEQDLKERAARYFIDVPTQKPADWCLENLRFDEADNHGPFSVAGTEYCIEPLNDFADNRITDEVLVWGSQTRKTGTLMGGAAWSMINDPCGLLWCMPSIQLARIFARNRWRKLLKASNDCVKSMIPTGRDRHLFTTLEQHLGPAVMLFFGSNSAGNLSSTPRRRVILDEVDKFKASTAKEADAVNLAEQRTKNQPNPQRWKTSTPTIIEGLIWQEALKGDMRRFNIPCYGCKKSIILAWSAAYTVLPKTGREAYIFWDKEAKRGDGDWDIERVRKSAHALCPYCGFHNLDAHKTWQNRNGQWVPTKPAPSNFISRHLPSLYSIARETTYGALAVKFLQAKHSLLGLQGFINGDLAEPYQSQDRQAERVEIITSRIEVTAEWTKAMMVDCQQKAPLFWFVIRAWSGGNSTGVIKGKCDTWDEVVGAQTGQKVQDGCVMVDSGFGARSESDVYLECARHAVLVDRSAAEPPLRPLWVGWLPAKGMPVRKRWKDKESGLDVPYTIRETDPFYGTTAQGQTAIPLFEFSGDIFADILDNLRRGKGGYKWQVEEGVADDEYWSHLDSEIKDAQFNPRTGKTVYQWRLINRHRLNHLKDCERMQIAYAAFHGWFKIDWSK